VTPVTRTGAAGDYARRNRVETASRASRPAWRRISVTKPGSVDWQALRRTVKVRCLLSKVA